MASPIDNQRLLTAAVVFFGIFVLVLAKKAGIDPDVVTAGGGTLILVAGMMHSMILGKSEARTKTVPPPKDEQEKKP